MLGGILIGIYPSNLSDSAVKDVFCIYLPIHYSLFRNLTGFLNSFAGTCAAMPIIMLALFTLHHCLPQCIAWEKRCLFRTWVRRNLLIIPVFFCFFCICAQLVLCTFVLFLCFRTCWARFHSFPFSYSGRRKRSRNGTKYQRRISRRSASC